MLTAIELFISFPKKSLISANTENLPFSESILTISLKMLFSTNAETRLFDEKH